MLRNEEIGWWWHQLVVVIEVEAQLRTICRRPAAERCWKMPHFLQDVLTSAKKTWLRDNYPQNLQYLCIYPSNHPSTEEPKNTETQIQALGCFGICCISTAGKFSGPHFFLRSPWICWENFPAMMNIIIWGFPKRRVSRNHPFIDGIYHEIFTIQR